jgi:PhzF family phenazine biosynthesis protein
MSRKAPFILVDVFTSRPFGGNQLAVFTDAAALTASEMQELAHEMNFSESTFVLPAEFAGAARRVRIFTPSIEMPMAGHPTVGTTWVLASRGEIALDSASVDATLQLGIGPVTVTIENAGGKPDFVWMSHREAEFGAKRTDREHVAKALGITAADVCDDLPIQTVSTGVPFLFVPLRTLEALAKCAPGKASITSLLNPGEQPPLIYVFVGEAVGRVRSALANVRAACRGCRGPGDRKRRRPIGRVRRSVWIDQTLAKDFVLDSPRSRDGTAERDPRRGRAQGQRRVRNPNRRAMRDRRRGRDVPLARRRS